MQVESETSTAPTAILLASTTTTAGTTLSYADKLHQMFGHASYNALHRLIKTGAVEGLSTGTPKHLHAVGGINCTACSLAKTTKARTARTIPENYLPTLPLERLDYDLIGPIKIGSKSCVNSYILVIMDVYTRYTWLYLLTAKSEATTWIIYHLKLLEKKFPQFKVKKLKSDGGSEFQNKVMFDYTMEHGIECIYSPPHTAHRNSLIERKNRQLLETLKTLLIAAGLPPIFWEYAAVYATYIINRLVRRTGPIGLTPYELLFKVKPKIKHMHVFGSDCIVYLRKAERDHKMAAAAMKAIYIGWYDAYQTHMVYSPETTNIFGTHHVWIMDGSFTTPINVKVKGYNNSNYDLLATKDITIDGLYDYKLLYNTIPIRKVINNDRTGTESEPTMVTGTLYTDLIEFGAIGTTGITNSKGVDELDNGERGVDAKALTPTTTPHINESINDSDEEKVSEAPLTNIVKLPKGSVQQRALVQPALNSMAGKPNKHVTFKLPPRTVKRKATNTVLHFTTTNGTGITIDCQSNIINKQLVHKVFTNINQQRKRYMISNITTNTASATSTVTGPTKKVYEPRTMREAQKLPQWPMWKEAAQKEIDSQLANGVWILVPASSVPTGLKPIKCRWVFQG
ncbi:MAG: DDE-type integrase/transposase/recombinase [Gammaproteobacteria bacterium]|nr:DDE-type integrase/transposase/recombinase [Gammaproteobacteria bacterium]